MRLIVVLHMYINSVAKHPRRISIIQLSTCIMQRRNEGLPKMQRAATQLINIQTFYSRRAVRLKIIVKYCHFCLEDLVFSKVCLDNFLV